MKSRNAILSLISIAAICDLNVMNLDRPTAKIKKPKTQPIPNGCSEFTIDGYTVIALNKKSALRKINKLKENENT